jgi:hypothetical protein
MHDPRRLLSLLAVTATVSACASAARTGPNATPTHATRSIERGADGLPIDSPSMNDEVEQWRRTRHWVLRASERCVSGAMDLYVPAANTRWARSVRVRIASPRELSFHIEVRRAQDADRYLSATMFGMEREAHERILREHGACIAQRAPAATVETPGATPTQPTVPTTVEPPAGGAPRRRAGRPARSTTTTTPRATATATVTTTVTATVPAVSAEAPLRAFVALADDAVARGASVLGFTKEFVLQREFSVIPMNDVNRSWVPGASVNEDLILRVWTQEPMDFEGVVVNVEDLSLEPRIPEDEYRRLMARRAAAGTARQQEFTELCRANPSHERCYFTEQNQRRFVGARRPPPPPREEAQPARPSADHLWVSGGWQWNGGDYAWISGMWRYVAPAIVATAAGTPAQANTTASATTASATTANTNATTTARPAVVTAAATFTAPSAAVVMPTGAPQAPAMRAEVIGPAPQAGAMWIAGYWQWDGRAWAWTAGHWELPPQVNVRWAPPAVQLGAGGLQVFMPGGWLRLGP